MKQHNKLSNIFLEKDRKFKEERYSHNDALSEITTFLDNVEDELDSVLVSNKNLRIINFFLCTLILVGLFLGK